MPLVSVIIPTHNRPHLLPRAVASARQAGADVEIIVVDDASSDETAAVCQTLGEIKYIRLERNQGVAGARNAGLFASHGAYLSFLDDDDARFRNSFDMQVAILEKDRDAMMIYGQALPEDHEGRRLQPYPKEMPQGDIFWQLLKRNFIPCGAALFRRDSLQQIGLLDERIAGIDDWDLWVRMAETNRILAIQTPVMIWRRSNPTSGQGTSNAARMVALSCLQFRQSWKRLPRFVNAPSAEQQATWIEFSENLAEHLLWESARALRFGRAAPVVRNLRMLSALHPLAIPRIAWKRAFQSRQVKAFPNDGKVAASVIEHPPNSLS